MSKSTATVALADLTPVTQHKKGHTSRDDLVKHQGKLCRVAGFANGRAKLEVIGETRGTLQQAVKAYRDFTGHEPDAIEMVAAPAPTGVAYKLGDMLGVMYEATRDGKKDRYYHEFKRGQLPVLAVAPDGSCIIVLGGGYKVTDHGIVG